MRNFNQRIRLIGAVFLGVVGVVGFTVYMLKPNPPQPPEELNDVGAMEAYFEQVVAAKRPPGLSVAVVKNGQIVYANGFGTVDAAGQVMASEETVYHWWSITKIATAVAVMNSSLESLVHLGDSVRGLGWEAHLTDTDRRYLTHSGGGPGFATILRLYPDEDLGVIVMGNDSTMDREILADVLANMAWDSVKVSTISVSSEEVSR